MSGRKGSRAQRKTQALLAHAVMYPEQHPRRYVLDEAHLVVPIPAPTPDQLSLPDREVDEDGVVWTFVLVPTPYYPVVTVTEETPALIYSHFGVT